MSLDAEKVRLGVTPTLWWNDDFRNIDIGITFGQCVSEMALAGFQGCSVGHKYPTDVTELKAALDLRGLAVSEPWVSTYFTINAMEEQTLATFHQQLDFIKAVGGTEMVVAEFGGAVNPLPVAVFANRPIFDDAQWDALTTGLNRLGKIAQDEGMRLCYHHHMGTGVMTRAEVDRLLANTDPALVNLLLDTGHLAFAGDDPVAAALAHADRIKHVHLKDVRPDIVAKATAEGYSFEAAIEAGVFTVPGDGSIDFVPIFEALADAGFEGWLVTEAEQDPAKANPLEYALKARAYLREVLGW
ncbi:myo-inosose-2 dehydratase [Solirubrobacter ginsenosidimutans]|uniref:Myo-inosose-2 dehydratase n=1 Tax=Solirubrobacter ginsenosidimutans TaxID=490573 RepID=A0A9X3MP91_9ACTN|nr:myo-inosose-2 dehydratase [Solirubrobacter ginsenosidimutans]MDA0160129.1 myo-inosose-2 dehydratase [Solirubrobacter ginsenosidimutans]